MPRPYAVITTAIIPGNCDVALLGRCRGRTGYVTQATVQSIAWTLTDVTLGTVLTSGTFAVASTIFDSLVTSDPIWAKDATGYNFRGVIAATSIPLANSGDRMAGDVKITMVSGEVLRGQFNWPTAKVYG